MATLYEYFAKDAHCLTVHETWPLGNSDGEKLGELTARLHLDFDANAKYLSFFIPHISGGNCLEAQALNKVTDILEWPETSVGVQSGFNKDDMTDGRQLVFTGQIYLYSERPVAEEVKTRLTDEARTVGHILTFRSTEYVNERNRFEKPLAFISHDSRDKTSIAAPIALQLQKRMCPVWYDEYSLSVGDSLRQKIEQGLRECAKCILVLTPNFLSNSGWSKREYDSIFTRELVEKENVILPVWHEIEVEDVYKYSPILADRVAVQWSLGEEEVVRRLLQAVNAQT